MVGLFFAAPQRVREGRTAVLIAIAGIYGVFHLLYFTNIIPPIPLAIKEIGIYHSILRTDNGYEVSFEPVLRYIPFRNYSLTFHWVASQPIYSYSSVFAPTRLDTTILHRWSYYDNRKEKWMETDRLGFQIAGGRDGGYRGYTFKTNVFPGKWRVEVITGRDQLLGRLNFEIVETDAPLELKTEIK